MRRLLLCSIPGIVLASCIGDGLASSEVLGLELRQESRLTAGEESELRLNFVATRSDGARRVVRPEAFPDALVFAEVTFYDSSGHLVERVSKRMMAPPVFLWGTFSVPSEAATASVVALVSDLPDGVRSDFAKPRAVADSVLVVRGPERGSDETEGARREDEVGGIEEAKSR